jgi:hypothetical protein
VRVIALRRATAIPKAASRDATHPVFVEANELMHSVPFRGLVAAAHTPFASDGSLALARV